MISSLSSNLLAELYYSDTKCHEHCVEDTPCLWHPHY